MQPADYDIEQLPGELAGAVIIPDLKCRQCGYNLRELCADGACPECGLEIWQTIVREIDPEASRLPKLREARRVGNGLLLLMMIMLVVAMMIAIDPFLKQLVLLGLDIPPQLRFLQAPMMTYLTGVLSMVGLWSVWELRPASEGQNATTSWKDIRLICLGVVGWSVMFLLLGSVFQETELLAIRQSSLLVSYAFAASIFLGLQGIFKTIGDRSRVYRRSMGGQQNLTTMVAALFGFAVGDGVQMLVAERVIDEQWRFLAFVLHGVCGFMLMVGLMYLTLNAWWIRRSITKPPKSLDELLMPQIPGEIQLPDLPQEDVESGQ